MADGHPQIERDAKARRELGRSAGVALIGMSSALEEGTHGKRARAAALWSPARATVVLTVPVGDG